jgi:hypothetical protein
MWISIKIGAITQNKKETVKGITVSSIKKPRMTPRFLAYVITI